MCKQLALTSSKILLSLFPYHLQHSYAGFYYLNSLTNRFFVHEIEYNPLSSLNLCHGSQPAECAFIKEKIFDNCNNDATVSIIIIITMP